MKHKLGNNVNLLMIFAGFQGGNLSERLQASTGSCHGGLIWSAIRIPYNAGFKNNLQVALGEKRNRLRV